MIKRISNPLLSRSFFLFGARGVGKTTWLKTHFSSKNSVFIDLLSAKDAEQFIGHPQRFEQYLDSLRSQEEIDWVIIDEIQKEPTLLDSIHSEIEKNKRFKFALTGSSARKLKRGGGNLLAGKAGWNCFFPLTTSELSSHFNLEEALNWGTLPSILSASIEERIDYLRTYTQVYLREEILEELLVRNATNFRKFLELAAQINAKILNYSKIALQAGVQAPTVRTYFDILEDTYLGLRLPAFHRSIRKQQTTHPKFYFFDNGVWRSILRALHSPFIPATSMYGLAFETWIINEVHRMNEILKLDYALSYLQTKDGAEIDLILERPFEPLIAIEIKSSFFVDEGEVRKLEAIAKDFKEVKIYYWSQDPTPKKIGEVECLYWKQGIERLFPILPITTPRL